MTDNKVAKGKAPANPWGSLTYGTQVGSNQVTVSEQTKLIKPTAVQNKGKLYFLP